RYRPAGRRVGTGAAARSRRSGRGAGCGCGRSGRPRTRWRRNPGTARRVAASAAARARRPRRRRCRARCAAGARGGTRRWRPRAPPCARAGGRRRCRRRGTSGRNRIGRSVWPWWHPIVAPTAPTEHRMTAYLIAKTAHIGCVIAGMAALFYLPRILLNLVETGAASPVRERRLLMGRRLYRFGHVMFGLAFVLGLVLWLGYRVFPGFPTMVAQGSGWLHAKLGLVLLLFAAWVVSGRWLSGPRAAA